MSLRHYQKYNFPTGLSRHHLDLSRPKMNEIYSMNKQEKFYSLPKQYNWATQLVLILKLTQTANSLGALGICPSPVGDSNFGMCSRLNAVGVKTLDNCIRMWKIW